MNKEIVVKSTVGLHAQLAAKVVQAASKYSVFKVFTILSEA